MTDPRIDPLFSMEDEQPKKVSDEENPASKEKTLKELEVEQTLKERTIYSQLVMKDPFYKEASESIKRMLSFDAWKSVRKRVEEPDVGDVCLGNATQRVDIIPNSLVAVFRMITTTEWRYILQAVQGLPPIVVPTTQAVLRLVFGLKSLDGTPVWDAGIIDQSGQINRELVEQKRQELEKRPLDVLNLLSTHYEWFRGRLHLLLEAGQVKNG